MTEGKAAEPHFLAHRPDDHVAVAVKDISPGTTHGCALNGDTDMTINVRDAIPLGHKIALVDLAEGADVIEYGVKVAVTSAPISVGEYVHTHNVRSARWQSSVAH